MRNKNVYVIGPCPLEDPCKKCLISMMCQELCDPKIIYDLKHPKPKNTKVKIKRTNIRKRRSYED